MSFWNRLFFTLPLAAVVASAMAAPVADYQGPSPELRAAWDNVMSDPRKAETARSQGAIAAEFCQSCHGEDGNSRRPYAPKLAGQRPLYLLDQLERFADGRRVHYVMGPLAKNLTDEDRIKVVAYFTAFPLKKAGGDQKLAAMGQAIYRQNCGGCHGDKGQGQGVFPRIAGQNPEYILNTVRYFRDRAAYRKSEHMERATYMLTDVQIEAVANFIANME